MAQTLGSDVPFVMLTASEVFSLEVRILRSEGRYLTEMADVKDRVIDSGVPKIDRRQNKGGDRVDRGGSSRDPG